MRDWDRLEELLHAQLTGSPPPVKAWGPYRDRKAILITDLSGFTRLMRERGPETTIALLHRMRQVAVPILRQRGGVVVKYQADDLFAAFDVPSLALLASVDLMRGLEEMDTPLASQVRLCMGIGYGDVLWWGENDVYGEEVNLASKLGEDTAAPGEILLTEAAVLCARDEVPGLRFSKPRSIEVGGVSYPYRRYLGGLSGA